MSSKRKDGRPSLYHLGPKLSSAAAHTQDCSHWCLPGVPNAWDEILHALILKQTDVSVDGTFKLHRSAWVWGQGSSNNCSPSGVVMPVGPKNLDFSRGLISHDCGVITPVRTPCGLPTIAEGYVMVNSYSQPRVTTTRQYCSRTRNTTIYSLTSTIFQLENNMFNGSIPSTIGLVESLEVMRLDRNALSVTDPSSINSLAHIFEIPFEIEHGAVLWIKVKDEKTLLFVYNKRIKRLEERNEGDMKIINKHQMKIDARNKEIEETREKIVDLFLVLSIAYWGNAKFMLENFKVHLALISLA
ncbi:hypothetical protein CTI12_AA429620 [Artemisia annua]|uniref:Trichome birefringence-like C-terminal domain-containing protein n=1 Tax=Artemisia annua TaxID=35608 RepID=A0A2U1M1Q2_ARTAN|nr:hypothetical protein CTI12_AA429620 [Artemisia annua]